MLINFEKQKLTLGQLLNGNITEFTSDDVKKVIKVITSWNDNTLYFDLTTSGSTGKPSAIKLHRDKLMYSAKSSIDFLDSNHQFQNTLLCINPNFIGGLMVVIRALVADLNLTIVPASSTLDHLHKGEVFDLTSMVPMQLQYLLANDPDKLNQFRTILIGGAPLPAGYEQMLQDYPKLRVYQTYGMTETASHIALKNISAQQKHYTTLGDVQIDTDNRQCLQIKGTITDQEWILTNDVVNIHSDNEFEWLGRADFVINSGGIKIHPEILEEQLSSQIKFPFFVAGMDDVTLGQKAVLIIETESVLNINFDTIDRYKRPKNTYCLPNFAYTDSGKINRQKTLELIKDS